LAFFGKYFFNSTYTRVDLYASIYGKFNQKVVKLLKVKLFIVSQLNEWQSNAVDLAMGNIYLTPITKLALTLVKTAA
jgi:hypothetical protein